MKNQKKITKAVITAAGMGTRFLPATKNQPKEMLPIIDKPIIHYLVEEAVNSGIKDIILVTRAGNHIMEDYFDNRYDLEMALEKNEKTKLLEMVESIPQMANFVYVRQKKNLPYGNGSPILAVKNLIDDDEAFVYMFGDDLTIPGKSGVPITKQLIDIYETHLPAAILGVQEVSGNEIETGASVKYKDNGTLPYEIEYGVEKTTKEKAPSNKLQFGRFIMSYDVIEAAMTTATGKDNELWVIDILNDLAKSGKKVLAPPIDGKWLTTGDPLRFLKTTLEFAMRRDDLKDEIKKYLIEEMGLCQKN